MGWWSTKIMGGDTPWDFEDIIYTECGLDKWPENHPKGDPETVISKELFDSRMDQIVKRIEEWNHEIGIGYQVLGYMAMKYGATLSEELRNRIISFCNRDEWAELDDERAKHINQLKDQIETYDNTPVPDLDKDDGVFAKIAEKKKEEEYVKAIEVELMKKMEDKLFELKSDERLTYQPATILVNAPLALIQLGMESQIHLLEDLLGYPKSKFPLEKKIIE